MWLTKTIFSFLLLVVSQAAFSQSGSQRLVIIDQDADGPGDSSMESMLLLLQEPSLRVLGITIESGDGWQNESVAHTLRMLEIIGRTDIPVYAGATYPLINSQAASRRWETLYGHWGYKGAWTESWPSDNTVARTSPHGPEVVPALPEGQPHTQPAPETAASFLIRAVHEHPNQITVVALGPVTNLALAARLDDSFAALAHDLIFMGGGFNPPVGPNPDEFTAQIADSPRMAFNIRWDPEAAAIVLHAPWPHITAVSEDATYGVRFTPEMMTTLAAAKTPAAQYIARWGRAGFPMWDDIAAALLLDPTLATHTRTLAMDVDLDRGANYGATLSWSPEKQPHLGEPTVTAILAVDAPRVRSLFLHRIAGTP